VERGNPELPQTDADCGTTGFFRYAALSKGRNFPVDNFRLPAQASDSRWNREAADEGNRED
jgi:hypothetical protein